MGIIVQKFGGTSVASVDRIKNVALIVKSERDKGNDVVVIVSAMSGVTDQLVSYANQCSKLLNSEELEEYDAVISSGEQITAGLLALALQNIGIPSRSYFGWQLPILSNSDYTKARIESIDVSKIIDGIYKKQVAVIAGFQALNIKDNFNRITTLGRGGSDTTAVAVAASLNADRCDIYTDMQGIYSADPRIVHKSHRILEITYEEMLEFAAQGAKILHPRSLELAMKYNVELRVLSSFETDHGTKITKEHNMESKNITGIAHSMNEASITLKNTPVTQEIFSNLFTALADTNISVDTIVKTLDECERNTDITFTISREDLDKTLRLLNNIKNKLLFESMIVDPQVAKVSLIGIGILTNPLILKIIFQTLKDKNINILAISTSEIKITLIISQDYMELALRSLHYALGLDIE